MININWHNLHKILKYIVSHIANSIVYLKYNTKQYLQWVGIPFFPQNSRFETHYIDHVDDLKRTIGIRDAASNSLNRYMTRSEKERSFTQGNAAPRKVNGSGLMQIDCFDLEKTHHRASSRIITQRNGHMDQPL